MKSRANNNHRTINVSVAVRVSADKQKKLLKLLLSLSGSIDLATIAFWIKSEKALLEKVRDGTAYLNKNSLELLVLLLLTLLCE